MESVISDLYFKRMQPKKLLRVLDMHPKFSIINILMIIIRKRVKSIPHMQE